jgi:alkylation response protein AidB-like acyl-CoA dehydrogenase
MIQEDKQQELRNLCFGAAVFPSEILDWIQEENLWNIWVPKTFGGLELTFSEGLSKLIQLAKIDASLGWTITLCSGANYFIGNLQHGTARKIFLGVETAPCLGGSGAVSGTAEIIGDHYRINGKWRYATGAPYLSHFTLNAEIQENGRKICNGQGLPKVLSFVVPKEAVKVIEDWNTMGLIATATHSFEVKDFMVHKECSFLYDECHLPNPIFKIPFALFADLTLWVNYIGIAEHLLEEASVDTMKGRLVDLEKSVVESRQMALFYASEIENVVAEEKNFKTGYLGDIHTAASLSVKEITRNIVAVFPYLGVKASTKGQQLNQIFCDYFTATQHHIFTKEK